MYPSHFLLSFLPFTFSFSSFLVSISVTLGTANGPNVNAKHLLFPVMGEKGPT